MTQEEQRALAIECGAWSLSQAYSFNDNELAAYTAAVEATREKELVELTMRLAEYQALFREINTNPEWAKHGIPDKSEILDSLLYKERERCALKCDEMADLTITGKTDNYSGEYTDEGCYYANCAEAIRSLK